MECDTRALSTRTTQLSFSAAITARTRGESAKNTEDDVGNNGNRNGVSREIVRLLRVYF